MILYATKQTIKELNIPMVDELSQLNRMLAQKVLKEQTNLLITGKKVADKSNYKKLTGKIRYSYYELRVNLNLNEEQLYKFLKYSKDI